MLLLGILIIYLIMVAQFQSLLSPFIVMGTVPLAFAGAFLGLLIGNFTVSIVAMIGLIVESPMLPTILRHCKGWQWNIRISLALGVGS